MGRKPIVYKRLKIEFAIYFHRGAMREFINFKFRFFCNKKTISRCRQGSKIETDIFNYLWENIFSLKKIRSWVLFGSNFHRNPGYRQEKSRENHIESVSKTYMELFVQLFIDVIAWTECEKLSDELKIEHFNIPASESVFDPSSVTWLSMAGSWPLSVDAERDRDLASSPLSLFPYKLTFRSSTTCLTCRVDR